MSQSETSNSIGGSAGAEVWPRGELAIYTHLFQHDHGDSMATLYAMSRPATPGFSGSKSPQCLPVWAFSCSEMHRPIL